MPKRQFVMTEPDTYECDYEFGAGKSATSPRYDRIRVRLFLQRADTVDDAARCSTKLPANNHSNNNNHVSREHTAK